VVIDLALSEIAYGLDVGDVSVTNGTLDNFDDDGDNINYELTVSPTAEGPVLISIPASTVVDRADLFNDDPLEFSFTYDVTPPSLDAITRLDSSPTNSQTVRYTVAFDEDMTNVTAADFTAVGASKAVTGASVASVVQIDPQTYRVTVNRGTGAGTLGLNVVTTGAATDLAGNDLSAGGTGPTYTISDLSIDEDLPSIVYAGGEGSDVILEIEASSSVSGLSYQWYQQGGTKAFTPIPSETTSSLFLPMVDPSLEGAQFYVEVSDSLVTENSNIATLTLSEGLPVGSAFGLAALAGLSALGGALTLRRRDQA
jgi:hypothetical protein